jgi:predicted aconitase with swiveling domain
VLPRETAAVDENTSPLIAMPATLSELPSLAKLLTDKALEKIACSQREVTPEILVAACVVRYIPLCKMLPKTLHKLPARVGPNVDSVPPTLHLPKTLRDEPSRVNERTLTELPKME